MYVRVRVLISAYI
uniref:Uncharacterized protein n=1 Tax=Anguilla anguilla TaxID=7936 RepID=A0A0E9QYR8_ANGAN